jgi:hypothetical protein
MGAPAVLQAPARRGPAHESSGASPPAQRNHAHARPSSLAPCAPPARHVDDEDNISLEVREVLGSALDGLRLCRCGIGSNDVASRGEVAPSCLAFGQVASNLKTRKARREGVEGTGGHAGGAAVGYECGL